MKLLPFENVLKLIEEGDYGTYRLFALPGQDQIAASHVGDDSKEKKFSAKDLITDLERKVSLYGEGDYLIRLKKSIQTPNTAEYVLRFRFGVNAASQPVQAQLAGYGNDLGTDKIEEIVERRVKAALEAEREKNLIRDQMKDLQHKLKELETAKRRRPVKKELGFLNGLVNLATIGAVTFVSEKFPNSVELVKETIKAMGQPGEEEEEEEEETGFERPAE